MSEKMRVAIVGLGVGFAHVAAFRQLANEFEIVAVCDPVESKREIARRFLDIPHGAATFDELLERDDLDIVDICTPPNLHVEMVRRVLETGRHAICEKPLAGSVAEIDMLAECERANPGRLMPIFQYRFGRGIERFRRILAAGLAGKPYVASVETLWTRGSDYYAVEWRGRFDTEMGGICISHAIHSHDLLVSLLGAVKSVYARTATRVNPIETEDCAAVTLEFESGALATLVASLGSARELSRLRLCFENLSVESGLSPYQPGSEPWIFEPANPDIAKEIDAALVGFTPGPELYAGQFLAFHDALKRDDEPPVTVADARASIELASAIYYSSRTGESVALPLGPQHPYYNGWS